MVFLQFLPLSADPFKIRISPPGSSGQFPREAQILISAGGGSRIARERKHPSPRARRESRKGPGGVQGDQWAGEGLRGPSSASSPRLSEGRVTFTFALTNPPISYRVAAQPPACWGCGLLSAISCDELLHPADQQRWRANSQIPHPKFKILNPLTPESLNP